MEPGEIPNTMNYHKWFSLVKNMTNSLDDSKDSLHCSWSTQITGELHDCEDTSNTGSISTKTGKTMYYAQCE